jgi:hypothetical protein
MEKPKFWSQDTFEISSFAFGLKSRINTKYTTSGSDNTGKCLYSYNEFGFRGDSIKKEGFRVMSIGCSFTEGVGVNDNETWPAQICKLIPYGINMNFGTGGRSNDFISRCLLTYYDLIKPNLVLIMYTLPHRREIYTKEGGIEPFIPTMGWGYLSQTKEGKRIQEIKTELQNDNEDFINWYKNHQLITLYLESKNCKWSWNGSFLNTDYIDKNRFDGDYIKFIDIGADGGHPGPKHNISYSEKLYKYLIDNQQIIKNKII